MQCNGKQPGSTWPVVQKSPWWLSQTQEAQLLTAKANESNSGVVSCPHPGQEQEQELAGPTSDSRVGQDAAQKDLLHNRTRAGLFSVAELLHTLTLNELSISIEANEINVTGNLAKLSQPLMQSLDKHKNTLMAMLLLQGKPRKPCTKVESFDRTERANKPIAYLVPGNGLRYSSDLTRSEYDNLYGVARSAIVKADTCKNATAYLDRLLYDIGRNNAEARDTIMPDPEQRQTQCRRCGSCRTYLATIHQGESLRQDCANCGRLIAFPSWYDQRRTQELRKSVQTRSLEVSKAVEL